jgi:hypothetical protein
MNDEEESTTNIIKFRGLSEEERNEILETGIPIVTDNHIVLVKGMTMTHLEIDVFNDWETEPIGESLFIPDELAKLKIRNIKAASDKLRYVLIEIEGDYYVLKKKQLTRLDEVIGLGKLILIGIIIGTFLRGAVEVASCYIYLLLVIGMFSSIKNKEFKDQIIALKKGWKGMMYSPVAIVILLCSSIIVLEITKFFPILYWGWLGYNIILGPNLNASYMIVVLLFAYFLTFIFNYYEESLTFRKGWKNVVLWAVLHMIMGIPAFAVIIIFTVGIFYKYLYSRKGREMTYVTHLFTNYILLTILLIIITI